MNSTKDDHPREPGAAYARPVKCPFCRHKIQQVGRFDFCANCNGWIGNSGERWTLTKRKHGKL